jgi:hypothetical protein
MWTIVDLPNQSTKERFPTTPSYSAGRGCPPLQSKRGLDVNSACDGYQLGIGRSAGHHDVVENNIQRNCHRNRHTFLIPATLVPHYGYHYPLLHNSTESMSLLI